MTVSDQELSAKIAAAIAPLAVEDGKAGDETEAEEWLLGTGRRCGLFIQHFFRTLKRPYGKREYG